MPKIVFQENLCPRKTFSPRILCKIEDTEFAANILQIQEHFARFFRALFLMIKTAFVVNILQIQKNFAGF